ncbi:DNA-3-methyladenine glycosylase II [Scopulibacillus darangshiensis]|uniref:DNA-3-methyladenine glycosylase II n=1 Tax=Scopulibacillus darangshiensis TaxID=442528 RepID=A0A4V2SKY2_9BACL|nr:DNA-3-methyladenine glycosylase [Scopulibacillus darangshiensis]TCP21326.1 DNA-3-methyladenine glycosylase II [Scopulibacillus darangshiensis]
MQDALEDHKDIIKIDTPSEFSFNENLSYLGRSQNECMFTIVDDKLYRAIALDSKIILVEIGADEESALTIRFFGHTIPESKKVRAGVVGYIRDWFDLDTDLLPFYQMAETDPLLKQPVSKFFGLRNMGIPDLFEALAWGIIGQQINLDYAYTLKRRFVEKYGTSVEWQGIKYWTFPAPEDIAQLEAEDLFDLKMTVKKCEYLIGVARMLVSGDLSKEKLLAAKSFKAAEKTLVNIRGIGPWTANYVLMRCLRFPSAFPIDDVGLHNAMKLVLGLEKKPAKSEIQKYALNWSNWESYATFYLWRLLY